MALIPIPHLRRLLRLHYVTNILLAISFLVLKCLSPFCDYLFSECQLDYKETEILFFTAVVIIFRTRKQGAIHLIPYVSTACMLAKMGNVLLYFYSDPVYGVLYLTVCILHLLVLPEPSYEGPENIYYLRGADLQQELQNDKRIVWFIELYTAWSPPCIEFSSVFSELSGKYGLENLKFGKIDLARNEETAKEFRINTSALSKQLPTLILFKNGKEETRRPVVNNNGKLVKFNLNFDTVVQEFDLNNVYKECKANPLKNSKAKRIKDD
ncbi:thioredoxin-related transmembrane protein 2 homolog [Oppia nitens]|uniref:thioredoxin-related transmembrane protein 2 homolog n=1 Tax=Oppia nitens TaxID=1686743 RepID=UPI0023DC7C21|nr:thioredoxin-related transmembrane protein 2 homolog [Oppia nitens]